MRIERAYSRRRNPRDRESKKDDFFHRFRGVALEDDTQGHHGHIQGNKSSKGVLSEPLVREEAVTAEELVFNKTVLDQLQDNSVPFDLSSGWKDGYLNSPLFMEAVNQVKEIDNIDETARISLAGEIFEHLCYGLMPRTNNKIILSPQRSNIVTQAMYPEAKRIELECGRVIFNDKKIHGLYAPDGYEVNLTNGKPIITSILEYSTNPFWWKFQPQYHGFIFMRTQFPNIIARDARFRAVIPDNHYSQREQMLKDAGKEFLDVDTLKGIKKRDVAILLEDVIMVSESLLALESASKPPLSS